MKFIIIFFLSSFLLFGSLYGFVIAVDPYNKLGNNLFGFETKAVDFARENKFNQIEHTKKQYEAFILGSSSAHRYETKELEKLTGLKSYNYAVQSTTPEDFLAITRHILAKQKPKLFILSLDFYGMNKNFATDDMFYSSPLKKYLSEGIMKSENIQESFFKKSYVTTAALSDSFKVAWVNLFGNAQHTYLEDGNHIRDSYKKGQKVQVRQYGYDDYRLDEKRINYLKEMKKILDKRGVRLVVFTAPLSYEHVLRIEQDPKASRQLKAFKEVTVEIFGEIFDFNDSELMKNYNTTEFFIDSGHPSFEFSKTILESMLSSDSKVVTIGRKLTKGRAVSSN